MYIPNEDATQGQNTVRTAKQIGQANKRITKAGLYVLHRRFGVFSACKASTTKEIRWWCLQMRYVSLYTENGGVDIGKIDDRGMLIWRRGMNILHRNPEIRDKVLRRDVLRIVKDDGKSYKQRFRGLITSLKEVM